uniref:RLF zinc finger n=1 Tax=Labrus bergylta TaxID=56723 RepID=A0A3Q3EJG3_9LABR
MAENNVEPEHEWSDRALDTAEDTLVAMETLLATLRAFEDVLRQQEISTASSTDYCDNFCQALMHYAGSRNSMEHGLPLLEVYCLSINCFAAARSHLTAESDRVALVLKRLALSCFELLLSVPENEIPYEAWVQFHQSVQVELHSIHCLLTEVDAYISLEGEGFMEMRVKHLEKMGEVAKAVVLAKACTECSVISNQATFRQTYVSLLCHLLPNEEISRLDCKDVLEITCSLETEGEENTAFILCTTFLTQQLQQQSLYCSWDLILLWSKLQRRIDQSLMSLLERCLQLGAIAKTVSHLLYLVRVIQTEVSVTLCVKALQLPKQDDSETRISICKMVCSLLSDDLEVLRACRLTEFLLGPSQEAFGCLEELYKRPDQKHDEESEVIPNSLRCELLLALKAYWPFDPEFWDWKTLKYHCVSLLGLTPESDGEEEEEAAAVDKPEQVKQQEPQGVAVKVESYQQKINGSLDDHEERKQSYNSPERKGGESETKKLKFRCQICKRSVTDTQIVHHSKRHAADGFHPCPVCLEKFKSRKDLVPHMKQHIQRGEQIVSNKDNVKKEDAQKPMEEEDDIEPGEITIDPSVMLYYKSTHDPDVLHHIVEQAKSVKEKSADDDEHVTFEYIEQHYNLQNRDEYQCPGTGCTRVFKHSKYLYVHLKSDHNGDDNVKYFHQMRDKREKCVFCRRHFVSAFHHRKHRRVHYGDQPYTCVVMGCGAKFSTSNELVMHKHTHGFHLNYQCELNGCFVTYSDLGQIYHHEAQHFRDAAFTCVSPECKKYYLSKKEFLKHLSTHNITFSEDDFEAQRKARRKLLKQKRAAEATTQLNKSNDTVEIVNGDVLNSSSASGASSSQTSEDKEQKATMTLVAVCFDGSKFTCGFEKCGMTFSRARDVQRHLKCAHPEHLKLENKEHKHDKERGSKSKGIKTETEPDSEERDRNKLSGPSQHTEVVKERKTSTHHRNNETNSSNSQTKNDALKDLVVGLGKLDLNASSHSDQSDSPQSTPDADAAQIALHQVKTETSSAVEEGLAESLATAKPYICEVNNCGFKTAQSYSLLRHYQTIHGRSLKEAKRLTSLETTSFKPYVCHFCSKSHREKHVLKAHYVQVHNLSETFLNKISNAAVSKEGKQTSQPLTSARLKEKKKEIPKMQPKQETKNSATMSENGRSNDSQSPSEEEEEGEDEAESKEEEDQPKGENGDGTQQQVRTTRRLVAKSNLCYILDKFSKPFHCVAKNCDAAFSTQGGLVRHLQLVHRYNRSQLLLEKDFDSPQCPEVKKDAVYHLKSSLARHTRDCHSHPSELIRCKYEGCTSVFSHDNALKKHTLYSHYEYYDSLVVRLQSTHKKSITGCQKKLIVTQQSPKEGESQAETSSPGLDVSADFKETSEEDNEARARAREKEKNNVFFNCFAFRSHEEALQMCQDRCLRVAYPCMVQDCDSVVTYMGSLHRHYLRVHRMRQGDIMRNEERLVLNAEQLEELIQRKSARPSVTGSCAPNGVHKMEYHTGGPTEDSATATPKGQKQDEWLSLDQIKPLLRPLTVDLSAPWLNGAALSPALPVRQPLKRKNELSEQPLNLKDPLPRGPSPRPFDITAYKPMGFESSFLRFIQETTPKENNEVVAKRRDAFKRGCSVKENKQLGISHNGSKRAHSPLLKPHTLTGDFTSIQNLKSILDKALAGCGDLAIKQLQYLRPVVVLERPVCTTTLPDLFPTETNNSKLLLGS